MRWVVLILHAFIRIPLIHNLAAESKMAGFFDGYYFRIRKKLFKNLHHKGKRFRDFKDVRTQGSMWNSVRSVKERKRMRN